MYCRVLMIGAVLFSCLAMAAAAAPRSDQLIHSPYNKYQSSTNRHINVFPNDRRLKGNPKFFKKPATPKEAAEDAVVQSTRRRADVYFGGRLSVGSSRREPMLCYVLLSTKKEYVLLTNNMIVFGPRCHWAITANLARDLVVNSTQLHKLAAQHDTAIVHEDYLTTSSYLVKTNLWKGVVLKLHGSYSHVWLMDADIKFADRDRLAQIEDEWFCGSVSGAPPLISQPTVTQSSAARQDYVQVNYFRQYKASPLSTMGTTIVENQIVLADMGFLYWMFREVIEPYFEKLEEYSITAWGLSRTWCRAAERYIDMSVEWQRKHNPSSLPPVRPLSCGIMPRPVYHISTKSINKTSRFIMAGKRISSKINRLFPTWHESFKVAHGYPHDMVQLAWNTHNLAVNDTSGALKLNKSLSCGHAAAIGRAKTLTAFAWV